MLLLNGVPDGVLGAADGVLHLAGGLLRGPFGLRLGVAGHLADSLFDGALYLMSDARDPIFVHSDYPGCVLHNTVRIIKFQRKCEWANAADDAEPQTATEYFPRLPPALPVSYIRLFLWLATEHSSVRAAHHSDLCGRLFMTVLDALKADHDEAKSLLKTILASKDGKKRAELFEQMKTKLTAHSRAEEKVFYRPLEKTEEGKTEALEGAVEHEVVDRLLADLAGSRQPEAEKWTARCAVLQELLEHHIEEEERDFFKIARKLFDRAVLEKMGKAFAAEKSKLDVAAHSAAAE